MNNLHWQKNINPKIAGYIQGGDSDDFDASAQPKNNLLDNKTTVQAQISTMQQQALELWKKYQDQKNINDLNTTIFLEKDIVNLVVADDQKKQESLQNLAQSLEERFKHSGNLDDLEEAISLQQRAVELTLKDTAIPPSRLVKLAKSLYTRYKQLGKVDDIEMAISLLKQSIYNTPDNNANKSDYFNNLGTLFRSRFNRFGEIGDIDQAILMNQQAVNLAPDSHAWKPGHLLNLGVSFESRFNRFGEAADIDKAILTQQQAIDLTPDGYSEKPNYLVHLGDLFESRFNRFGKAEDIDQAILAKQQVVDLTPDGYTSKPDYINNLGTSFQNRYDQFGKVTDINQAVLVHQQAVDLAPGGHTSRPNYLLNLGNSLRTRFEQFGKMADIDQAILAHQQAVDLAPEGHVEKPDYLVNLGISFQCRFESIGEVVDIDKAILLQQQAVDLVPDGDPNKTYYLNNLAISFSSRFEWLGEVRDLDQALLLQRQTIDLTPDENDNKPLFLNNLGNSFQARFSLSGQVADIDHAISARQQAIDLIPDSSFNKPSILNSLGISFQSRFGWFGEATDVDQAFLLLQQAIDLTPNGHAKKPKRLIDLGGSLESRFERFGNIADIDQAILVRQQAIDLTPDDHASKVYFLIHLGTSLQRRFESFGEVTDIDQAVLVLQRAVDLTPDGHSDKPNYLVHLGISFESRFERFGKVADIKQAVFLKQQAVDLTPNGHANKPHYLNSLGYALNTQFNHTYNVNHLLSAISAYSASALSSTGSPHIRLDSALQWAVLASDFPYSSSNHHLSSLQACHTLIDILPRLIWLGNSVSLRYQDIASVGDYVNIAASIACSFDRFDLALKWLEQGRSIVWGQILNLQTPVSDLRRDHPELAIEMESISSRLQSLSPGIANQNPDLKRTSGNNHASIEQTAQEHRRFAEQWENLLLQIRQRPKYKNFLQPKTLEELASAASSGPIVFVNIQNRRCDAIILLNVDGSPTIDHVHLLSASQRKIQMAYKSFGQFLANDGFKARTRDIQHLNSKYNFPGLSADKTSDRASFAVCSQGDMKDVLEMLWSTITEPVIRKLGYTHKAGNSPKGSLPHVTWCTTGPLAFLPLHAAGRYDPTISTTQERTYNYVVSSYAPSISSLIKKSNNNLEEFHGLVAISQPSTANNRLSRVPGTVEEISRVKGLFLEKDITWLNESKLVKASVLEKMSQSSWLHLACHGVQKKENPMSSAFLLHDGPLDLQTISQQRLPNARLAFLSACQTATGDEKLPSEAAHLAAGLLMIGYHSVIGTMWSIKDQDAPLVAEEFYKYLVAHDMKTDSSEAAYALHEAVGLLREKVGVDQFARWVPFIHLGI